MADWQSSALEHLAKFFSEKRCRSYDRDVWRFAEPLRVHTTSAFDVTMRRLGRVTGCDRQESANGLKQLADQAGAHIDHGHRQEHFFRIKADERNQHSGNE